MIRANKKFLDIQNCIFEMIKYKCDNTAPWTSWQPLLGYPESEQFEEFTKPFIYIESPVPVDTKWQQAGRSLNFLEMIIGIWTDRKTQLFDKELNHSARLFRTLSHPARLRILKFLAETNTCITGDISEDLPLGRTTVNQHLAELKDADLITGHVEGVKTRYCLNIDKIAELKNTLEGFLSSLDINEYHCK